MMTSEKQMSKLLCVHGLIKVTSLFVLCSLYLIGTGLAAETPILVAKDVPQIDRWCGDHAVYFFNTDLHRSTILDVLTGRQLSLEVDHSAGQMLGCSGDGRWVLAAYGGETGAQEGGDPSCGPRGQIKLPQLILWDTRSGTRSLVGRGFASFRWSPDGTVLLYRFDPICDLELDRRNTFKLPSAVRAFQAVSVRNLIGMALGLASGWPDKGRIGDFSWYVDDAFVVQLPAGEGNRLTNATPGGAIVAVHQQRGHPTRVEQLNPPGFESSWKLAIAQAPPEISQEILGAADCIAITIRKPSSSMLCNDAEEVKRTGFRPDLVTYCKMLNTGDVTEFCAPVPPALYWSRLVGKSVVLVVKPTRIDQRTPSGYELFRMEHDQGGYLK
jgi:hypothetical protein